MRPAAFLILGVAIAALTSAGAVFAFQPNDPAAAPGKASARAAARAGTPAGFSVFAKTAEQTPDAGVREIAADLLATPADLDHFQVLADHLGTFESRLIAFPAMSGRNVCYSLLGHLPTEPGMSYCYRPGDTHVPPGLAGERFSVVAPESHAGETLDVETQVFGVAEDSVTSARVLVSGAWRDLPIENNGFYLDLPGVPRADVGTVEATLADGTTQVHDLRTGE